MTLTSNPNGLSYHENRLYMVDSNFNHHVNHAQVSAYNVQENTWTELTQNVSSDSKKAKIYPFFWRELNLKLCNILYFGKDLFQVFEKH